MSDIPAKIESPDWTPVTKLAEELMTEVATGEAHGDSLSDYHHYIMEEVLKVVYGQDVFKWYNAQEIY